MNERWAIYFCIMGNKVSRFLSSIIKMKAFLVSSRTEQTERKQKRIVGRGQIGTGTDSCSKMARALLSAFPNKFDLFSFVPFIQDEDAAVQTCFDLGLIPNVLICADGHGVRIFSTAGYNDRLQ
jgi:hypothetical protein